MSRELFVRKSFSAVKEEAIDRANQIVKLYTGQGLRLTLRQLYYQFVTRNWITNEEKSYKWLGGVVSDGRLAGEIDWDAIEDRGRVPDVPLEFRDLRHRVDSALTNYRLSRWEDQDCYVELWVEKQALAGVLSPIAQEHHVPLMVNKGYSSQSAMYESAQRFIEQGSSKDRDSTLLYIGDHDPSGEDMVRDIRDRMAMFGVDLLEVRKIALTWAQITKFKPPPNPAKLSDSRAKKYIERFGDKSWEVDAIPPDELVKIIRTAFANLLDWDRMEKVINKEEEDKDKLRKLVESIM